MGAGRKGKTPWDLARERARRSFTGFPAGTALHLAYFDANGVDPRIPRRPGCAASSVEPCGHGLSGPLWHGPETWPLPPGKSQSRVYLLSDLQRSGIRRSARRTVARKRDGHDRGRRPSAHSQPGRADVQAEQTELRPGTPVTIAARIVNAGPFPARAVRLSLSLDGISPVEQTIDLEPHARRVVRFQPRLEQPGLYHGAVGIVGEDDLPPDDRRWLAFEARRPDRILLVDGEPGPSVYSHETYYLETALRLRVARRQDLPPRARRPMVRGDEGAHALMTRFVWIGACAESIARPRCPT